MTRSLSTVTRRIFAVLFCFVIGGFALVQGMSDAQAVGLGFSALLVALLAFVMPKFGDFFSWLALTLVTIAALIGDRLYEIAMSMLVAANTLFFCPATLVAFFIENHTCSNLIPFLSIVLVAAPFVAVAVYASGSVVIGNRAKAKQ